jgi:hypothetical protein
MSRQASVDRGHRGIGRWKGSRWHAICSHGKGRAMLDGRGAISPTAVAPVSCMGRSCIRSASATPAAGARAGRFHNEAARHRGIGRRDRLMLGLSRIAVRAKLHPGGITAMRGKQHHDRFPSCDGGKGGIAANPKGPHGFGSQRPIWYGG